MAVVNEKKLFHLYSIVQIHTVKQKPSIKCSMRPTLSKFNFVFETNDWQRPFIGFYTIRVIRWISDLQMASFFMQILC